MHFKLASTLAFTTMVAAATTPGRRTLGSIPLSQCNPADVFCCNSLQSASSSQVAILLGLLGVVLQDPNELVGLTCSSVNVPGGSCTAQPVCCTDHSFNGLLALGCVPIDVNA